MCTLVWNVRSPHTGVRHTNLFYYYDLRTVHIYRHMLDMSDVQVLPAFDAGAQHGYTTELKHPETEYYCHVRLRYIVYTGSKVHKNSVRRLRVGFSF